MQLFGQSGDSILENKCLYRNRYNNSYCENDKQADSKVCIEHQKYTDYESCMECGTLNKDKTFFTIEPACAESLLGSYPCCEKQICLKCKYICYKCNDATFNKEDIHRITNGSIRFACMNCYTSDQKSFPINLWWGMSTKEWEKRYG
ncbi:hypothetical protein QKU48_gp0812 [Fadolivirus algeromassiliense]|jgi:hypothetical protein|uniref:Uncharacterized protein n=1 Tax=Fadolivirus FV1/VV64 TaxID=3070911 RepID=A0A7D3UTF2_9VIRU|nr:hypothetical protein QKU48_gp0812 [Fadolivirus algeromassiliense]QKF94270.1 hypothetical protein Fadolivirus_1_812 [Fadolivirus FV1/VV64]